MIWLASLHCTDVSPSAELLCNKVHIKLYKSHKCKKMCTTDGSLLRNREHHKQNFGFELCSFMIFLNPQEILQEENKIKCHKF